MKTRKILNMILCILMTVSCIPFTAAAADITDSGKCGDKVTYTLNSDGLLTVRGTGDITDNPWISSKESITSVLITGKVTGIVHGAFSDCTELTEVTIPDSVTNIGYEAFFGCTGLTEVKLPKGLKTVEDDLFCGCKGLKSVTFPDGIASIGWYAFCGCSSLTEVTIPESVTRIGWAAFDSCTSLININLPDGLTAIEDYTFYGCTSLADITIPDSVAIIGINAFENTPWYNSQPDGVIYAGKVLFKYKGTMPDNTSITISDGTKGIADSAFSGCRELTEIFIPDTVTRIGDASFSDCRGLTDINIPDSVTSIGSWTFQGCTKLENVIVPDSVTSIGSWAFNNCQELVIHCNPDSYAGKYAAENGVPSSEIPECNHDFSVKRITEKYLKSEADCTSPAVYYYKCSKCSAKGTSTYTSGSALGHSWNDGVITKAATTESTGIKTYTCTHCNKTKTETIPVLVPVVPENVATVTVSDVKVTSATLSWSAAANATHYRIYSYDPATKKYTAIGFTESGTTEYTVQSLTADTDYTFAVRPFNNCTGKYVYSSAYTTVTLKTASYTPSNATGLTAADITVNSAVLKWDPALNATHYRIYSYDTATRKYTSIACTTEKTTEYTVTGLSPETSYTFAVRPFNNATGEYIYSTKYTTVSFDTASATPANIPEVTTADITIDSAVLKWEPASNATHYRIYSYDPATRKYTAIACTTAKITEYKATELNPETDYTFAVRPFNNATGLNIYSSAYTSVSFKTASAVPENVSELTAADITVNSAVLKWEPALNATHYRIYSYDSATRKYTAIACTTAKITEYKVTELSPATSYTFAVRPFNNATGSNIYSSAYTTVSLKTTSDTIPENATGLTAADVTTGSAVLKWDAVPNATHYRIYSYDSATRKYTSIGCTTGKTTVYTVSGLAPETKYTFAVRPFSNVTGQYVYSSGYTTVSFKTASADAPANAAGLTVTAVTDNSASLKWDAAPGATHYRIYIYDAVSKKYTAIGCTTEKNTVYTATGLTSGTSYTFAVRPFSNTTGTNIYSPAYTSISCTTN